jgi:hypothetical protein
VGGPQVGEPGLPQRRVQLGREALSGGAQQRPEGDRSLPQRISKALDLAADFAGAVADRFGVFGRPGAPGVSWGSWSAFVDYTRTLLHQPPEAVAVVSAAGATAAEVALGSCC